MKIEIGKTFGSLIEIKNNFNLMCHMGEILRVEYYTSSLKIKFVFFENFKENAQDKLIQLFVGAPCILFL